MKADLSIRGLRVSNDRTMGSHYDKLCAPHPMDTSCDFLILGSGIAGLLAARKLSTLGTVCLLTKKKAAESNTNYAQGGIAAVMSRADSFSAHVADTLAAGAGLCDERVV